MKILKKGGVVEKRGDEETKSMPHAPVASSTGRAAFMGDDPFVNPLCIGFCILWINDCILSLITASTILLITGRTVIPR